MTAVENKGGWHPIRNEETGRGEGVRGGDEPRTTFDERPPEV